MRTALAGSCEGTRPLLPAWPDVVQLNAFSPEPARGGRRDADRDRRPVRRAAVRHGDADDQRGVRPYVGRAGRSGSGGGLLADADRPRASDAHPDLLFMAEAYWDMEWTLQQQGFDLCYDKRLYDRLRSGDPADRCGRICRPIRLSGAADPVHRESRRAACCRHVRAGPSARGRGRHVDPAGRTPVPRRPARRAPDEVPVFLDPRTRRATRRRAARVLRAAAARRRRRRPARRRVAPVPTSSGWPDNDSAPQLVCVVLVDARSRATWWWSTSPMVPRRRSYIYRGRTSRAEAGSSPDRLEQSILRA